MSETKKGPLDCVLCTTTGGEVLWEDDFCRVISVTDADYPGFCRVILQNHVAEMTDLDESERQRMMNVVFTVEMVLRTLYQPDKINLASFGNVVPHLHWHLTPRWRDDRHFPESIWGTPQRVGNPSRPVVPKEVLADEIAARMSGSPMLVE